MNESSKVCVRVPASTANLGPGFDCVGMALSKHLWIEMGWGEQTRIELYGDDLHGVPCDESNLVFQVAKKVFQRAGVIMPGLSIAMYSDIPLTRGMGSSASAIVGALVAANEWLGAPLSEDDLFQMATAMEDHPDNAGASLFGGIVVGVWDGAVAKAIRLEPHPDLGVVMLVPTYHLETEYARSILPRSVTLKDAVHNLSRSSLLVAALATGDLGMLRYAMQDVLHQPYRAKLIPGMERVLAEVVSHGALGAALSGSGPALIAFVDRASDASEAVESFMLAVMQEAGVPSRVQRLQPEPLGACRLLDYDPRRTLLENIHQMDRLVRKDVFRASQVGQ